MKKSLLAFVILFSLFGCAQKQEVAPQSQTLPERDPARAYMLVQAGALLLDVRTAEEYQERHLDGSHLVPVQELPNRFAEVELLAGDKAKPIVVYCRSGKRAAQARELLLKNGFTSVTNLGGIDDWPQNK